jgi:hypothetical protein
VSGVYYTKYRHKRTHKHVRLICCTKYYPPLFWSGVSTDWKSLPYSFITSGGEQNNQYNNLSIDINIFASWKKQSFDYDINTFMSSKTISLSTKEVQKCSWHISVTTLVHSIYYCLWTLSSYMLTSDALSYSIKEVGQTGCGWVQHFWSYEMAVYKSALTLSITITLTEKVYCI